MRTRSTAAVAQAVRSVGPVGEVPRCLRGGRGAVLRARPHSVGSCEDQLLALAETCDATTGKFLRSPLVGAHAPTGRRPRSTHGTHLRGTARHGAGSRRGAHTGSCLRCKALATFVHLRVWNEELQCMYYLTGAHALAADTIDRPDHTRHAHAYWAGASGRCIRAIHVRACMLQPALPDSHSPPAPVRSLPLHSPRRSQSAAPPPL